MPHPRGIELAALSLQRFAPLVGEETMRKTLEVAASLRCRMSGRILWNVNSTAVGGGVAEMVHPMLRYVRGAGIDTRWLVIEGTPEFFRVTKRLHHALHGSAGDGSSLGKAARQVYEETLRGNACEIAPGVRPGDIALLHDPQTAGLAPWLSRAGARVIWRCHIGHDRTNEEVERGWAFLAPYLDGISAYVFSRRAYIPARYDHGKSTIIQPSINPFSAKNRDLHANFIHTTLVHTGLVEGPPPPTPRNEFMRDDGSPGRVEHRADVLRLGRAPRWETPLVVQVSRWDPLKDPVGVMHGFRELLNGRAPGNAELVLAGSDVNAVTDDPEGASVFEAVIDAWRALPYSARARIHIASLPMASVEENAIIVNALQRHAAVVVQKSLREGFGLTVTEAMWKERPVLASAVGGIQDQIEDGVNGILLEDPQDEEAFATLLRELLSDPERRAALGREARERVRERFLGHRHLMEYARLIERIDDDP